MGPASSRAHIGPYPLLSLWMSTQYFLWPLTLGSGLLHTIPCGTTAQMTPPFYLAWHCHWRCWYEGYQVATPWLVYLLGAPHLHWVEQVLGVRRLSSGFPPSIWLCRGRRSKWLLGVNPPFPSQIGYLPVIHIRIPISHRISPRCWWCISGGCIQLSESDLPAEILHELTQLIIHKISKVCLQLVWGPPTQVGVAREKWGSSSPSEGRGWALEGSSFTTAI